MRQLVVGMAVGLLVGVGQLQADTIPLNLAPGDSYRLVFVTPAIMKTTATVSSISYYNRIVSDAAFAVDQLADLNIDWYAIASTGGIDARTNTMTRSGVDDSVPIYRLDGIQIAASYDDLWDGSLSAPILLDPDGSRHMGGVAVWTGSDQFGYRLKPLGAEWVTYGSAFDGSTSGWMHWSDYEGDFFGMSLYGISGVLTVPEAFVPTPSALISLLGLGMTGAGLGWWRKRR